MTTDSHETRQSDDRRRTAALAECLRREASAYRQMLELMLRQRDALVQNDVATIEACAASEEKLLRQLSNAHKRTEAMLAHVAAQHGLGESATISDVLGVVSETALTELAAARDELQAVVEQVHRENATNSALLVNAVEYVGFCMRLFGDQQPALAYSPGGLKASGASNLAVDLKA